MPRILPNPGKRRLIATAISVALLSAIPQLTFAADGQAGGPATSSDSAQGGGGGTMDTTTGIGGNGGSAGSVLNSSSGSNSGDITGGNGGRGGNGGSNTTDVADAGAGLMAGYGNVQGNSRSNLTGYRSESELDGYSVGAYGTWYQNAVSREGVLL